MVENPQKPPISEETTAIIDKMRLERGSLAGIARVTGVSVRWRQNYVNDKYENIPMQVPVSKKRKGRLTIEGEELWSLVGNQDNQPWIGLALDRDTGEIVGVAEGSRSHQTAQPLWDSLPAVDRQGAVSYTDFWEAYKLVFPQGRHRQVGKETGQTNHIERLNGTLRPRISRLVRKTWSFSQKLTNHIGALWHFIHYSNDVYRTCHAIQAT